MRGNPEDSNKKPQAMTINDLGFDVSAVMILSSTQEEIIVWHSP
jgi:hypothetical protein